MTSAEIIRANLSGMSAKQIEERILVRWELAMRDPIYFMRWFVYTIDQHDSDQPIKAFPWDKPYIQHITGLCVANDWRLSIVKSRQMIITWWAVVMGLWRGLSGRGQLIMLQSKRLDDAVGDENSGDGLLGRAKCIMNNMPARQIVCPDYLPLGEKIKFTDRNSTLWAIPQGAAIIRQRTASLIISDEAAFQPEAGDSYTAARPCIRGGGGYISVTTPDLADGGHTRCLHEDRLDEA